MTPSELRKEFTIRRTGKTTAIALRALSDAISNPGEWSKVADHHWSPGADKRLFLIIRRIAQDLDLKFEFNASKLEFRSINYGLLVNKETNAVREATEEERGAF